MIFAIITYCCMTPRSRNFDGCWTCRKRKIKCDCTRPACTRCTRANRECGGYGIILAWADTGSVGKNNEMVSIPMVRSAEDEGSSQRRNVDLVKFPKLMQYDDFEKLNLVVYQFDDITKRMKDGRFVVGPFGVFLNAKRQKVHSRHSGQNGSSKGKNGSLSKGIPRESPRESPREPRLAPRELTQGSRGEISTQGSRGKLGGELPTKSREISRQVADLSLVKQAFFYEDSIASRSAEPETSLFSKTDNSYVHYSLLDSSKLTVVAIKGTHYKLSEQSMFHILYPKFYPNMDSDDWRPGSKSLLSFFYLSDGKTVTTPELGAVCGRLSEMSFVRVRYPKNSWDTLVIPFVKQIIFELVCEEFAGSNYWKSYYINRNATIVPRDLLLKNLKWGILCMSFSVSAFQKSLLHDKSSVNNDVDTYFVDEDLKLSIETRKLGINVLNYHLDEFVNNSKNPDNDAYDTYFLLAMILQIHLDNCYGVFENYELVYAIGEDLIKKNFQGKLAPLQRFLKNTFNILNIFYMSTQAINFFNYSISEKDQRLNYLDLNESYDLTKNAPSDDDDLSELESGSTPQKEVRVSNSADASRPFTYTVWFKNKTDSELSTSPNQPNQPSTSASKAIDAEFSHPRNSIRDENSLTSPVTPYPGDSSVYVMFGLPKSLIQLFHEVIQLTNHKNVFRTKGVTPRNFPRLCAETEDKILNWKVESYWNLYVNEFNPVSNDVTKSFPSSFHEGLYYNVTSFHAALIVYYKRLIPVAPILTYQNHIHDSFSAMESLLRLNDQLQRTQIAISFTPSFWPLLICGCDIDMSTHGYLKQKCQEFWKFESLKKYNYWRSKQILFEVWQRRTQGENNGFMDMIREWDIVLSLG